MILLHIIANNLSIINMNICGIYIINFMEKIAKEINNLYKYLFYEIKKIILN